MKDFGILASSADPSKISATVTGAIIFSSAIIIGIAGHYGIQITSADVTQGASQIGEAVGSLVLAFGLLRKVVIFIHSKF